MSTTKATAAKTASADRISAAWYAFEDLVEAVNNLRPNEADSFRDHLLAVGAPADRRDAPFFDTRAEFALALEDAVLNRAAALVDGVCDDLQTLPPSHDDYREMDATAAEREAS